MVPNLILLGLLLLHLNGGISQAPDELGRARQLIAERKYLDAEQELQRALAANPENIKAVYMSGLCLLELEKFQAAEQRFASAGQILKDETAPEKMAEDPGYPRSDQVLVGLARAYIGRGELDRAARTLDEAEKITSENPELYYHRGMLDARRKDYAAASNNLERSIELEPENAYAHYYAGLAYNQIKRPDKMLEHFRFFLKLAPEAPEAAKVKAILRGIR